MNIGIRLESGKYGRRAVATSGWSRELTDYVLAHGVAELELNEGWGWLSGDLSFLSDLPRLEAFKIVDFKIRSVAPIHFLPALRALEVSTYCQTEIRFSTFPRLEECTLEWRPLAATLFDCTTLKRLCINRYDGKNVNSFMKLINLVSLTILNAPVEDVRGLSAMRGLRFLRLANLKRLTSLAGIESLANLEELEIHTCRAIGSIDEVACLVRLRNFNLNNDGDIKSLKPLQNLTELESIVFYESTNILDGDLSPLLRGKHLTRVSFQNRRHYSHRREEFGIAYNG